jgi:hypothetical protein
MQCYHVIVKRRSRGKFFVMSIPVNQLFGIPLLLSLDMMIQHITGIPFPAVNPMFVYRKSLEIAPFAPKHPCLAITFLPNVLSFFHIC